VVGTLLIVGCQDSGPQLVSDLRILRMMQCQECQAGERRAVIAMRDTAVAELRQLLLNGPPLAFVSRLDSVLRAPIGLPISPGDTPHVASSATVKLLLEDYHTMYQVRASYALGGIGTDSAKQALCAGKAQPFQRREVREAIDSSLGLAGGTCP
jgi:hypothetical protein